MDSPQNINIKILNLHDYETLKNFHNSCNSDYKISDQSFKNYLSMPQYKTIGLFFENQLVSYIIFLVNIDSADIIYITTHPDFRRKGIASILLNAPRGAFWYLKKNINFHKMLHVEHFEIFLEVEIDNVSALNFYIKEGFEKISIRKQYLKGKDAVLMIKNIL